MLLLEHDGEVFGEASLPATEATFPIAVGGNHFGFETLDFEDAGFAGGAAEHHHDPMFWGLGSGGSGFESRLGFEVSQGGGEGFIEELEDFDPGAAAGGGDGMAMELVVASGDIDDGVGEGGGEAFGGVEEAMEEGGEEDFRGNVAAGEGAIENGEADEALEDVEDLIGIFSAELHGGFADGESFSVAPDHIAEGEGVSGDGDFDQFLLRIDEASAGVVGAEFDTDGGVGDLVGGLVLWTAGEGIGGEDGSLKAYGGGAFDLVF